MRVKILILGLTCLLLCGCKDKAIEYDEASESESMKYRLACIDAGYNLPRNDGSIEKFRILLQKLNAKFIENEKQIGDISISIKFLLRDEGIQESLLNIMKGMNQLFFGTPEDMKYADYTRLYLNMRKKGYSHNNTIMRSWILIHTGIR